MSFKCRIKIQRKRIEFRKGRLFAVMKKKNKKKTEFFPRRQRYIFHLRDSIRYFLLSLLPLSPSPPSSPLFPWKTQFLASVKSQRTIENAHDQSIYFLVYFRITKVRGQNLREYLWLDVRYIK